MSEIITVSICTYQRPDIEQTLMSLVEQEIPEGYQLKIVIADNDKVPSAAGLVSDLKSKLSLDILYIHAPSRNISVARNACLEATLSKWMFFIDDDEIATKYWIHSMLETALIYEADVVIGPVNAVYRANAPEWIVKGDFHSTRPHSKANLLNTAYTCNTLINLHSEFCKGLKFDIELGRSGGEDTVFFAEIYRNGGKIVYSPNSVIFEKVPENRETFEWLSERRFRSGQSHAMTLLSKSEGNWIYRSGLLFPVICKYLFCLFITATLNKNYVNNVRWKLRKKLHKGVLFGLLGKKKNELY